MESGRLTLECPKGGRGANWPPPIGFSDLKFEAFKQSTGADPEIFERGGPEAIIHKILERGGPNSLKMAFECSFQLFSYKSFANIPPKGGAPGPSPKSATGQNETFSTVPPKGYVTRVCVWLEDLRVKYAEYS